MHERTPDTCPKDQVGQGIGVWIEWRASGLSFRAKRSGVEGSRHLAPRQRGMSPTA